nr:6571_t:CDS:2 [Entrophospora candida]
MALLCINNANVAPNSILIRQFPSPPTSPSSEKQLSVVAQSPAIKHETNLDEDYEKEIADDGTYIKQEQDDTIISNLSNDDSDDSSNHRHQQQLDFLSINPKQRNRIIKRRFARERFEKKHGFSKQRKPYIHESRHVHALRRPRGPGGRFLNANQMAEIEERRNRPDITTIDGYSYQPQLISLPSSSPLSIQTAPMTPIQPFQTHSPYHTQQSFQQQQLSPCSPGFQGIDYNNSGYLLEQSNHFDHQLYNTVVPSSFAEYACDNDGSFY